jgi:hypothetical protein
MIFLTSCSNSTDSLKDESSDQNNDSIVRIDDISNQVFNIIATEELLEIQIGPIKNSSGDIVSDNQSFKVSSPDTSIQFEQSTTLINELNKKSISGVLTFKVKVPTLAKQYSIQVQGIGLISSVGFIYINVTPESIFSLGSVVSEVFEDTSPFNKIKDSGEKYAIVKNTSVDIKIGPITDKWGNNIQEGSIDAIIKRGVMLDKLDENGNVTNKARISIINGFAQFSGITSNSDGTTFVGAKYGGTDNLEALEFIDVISEDDPALDGIISVRDELIILQSILNFNADLDFGVVYLGNTQSRTITLQNLGNTPIYNRTVIVDSPFEVKGGTCLGKSTLLPLEFCSLNLEFNAQIRIFAVSQIYVNGTYNNQNLEEQLFQATVQSSLPPNLKFDIDDNIIVFDSQPVGELISIPFSVINTGDVVARNVQLIPPPAYSGTTEGYFVFRSPPITVPNQNPELGEHCGQNFSPQVRCIVYVDFLPKSKVPSDILGGTLVFDEGDPISIFVKGKSFVNNFEDNVNISSISNKINKDEVDSAEVIVGPIRDIFGAVVPNQNVFISVYSEKETVNGLEKKTVGSISSPNQILGGPTGITVIRTDINGYANFSVKSKFIDKVGNFFIKAQIVDEDSNILTEGIAEYEFVGAKLEFEIETYNFLTAIVNNEKTLNATLFNNGTIDAKNIRVFIQNNSPQYSISNEGSCLGVLAGTLNLDTMESCSLNLSFTPSARFNFFDRLSIESSTIGNKNYSALFGKGINPATLTSFESKIVGTHVIQGQNLTGSIVFSNVGDEAANSFSVEALNENNSFIFNFDDCVTVSDLEPGKRCSVNYEYNPSSIPNQELITSIRISARGLIANNLTTIEIPIEISHSSLVFNSTTRGINVFNCYPMKIKGFDSSENLLDFSNDIVLDLLTDSPSGQFYSDDNCSLPTSTVLMTGNSFLSEDFYYRSTLGGTTEILSAKSTELAQAKKSFIIYKDPISFEVVSGDSQTGETSKSLVKPLIFRTIDEDNNGIPNIPIIVDILSDISKEYQYIQNPSFNNNIDGWIVESGSAEWFKGAGASLKLISTAEIAEIVSFPILTDVNTTYNYSVKVSEATGLPEAAHIIVTLEDRDFNVIETHIVDGVKTKAFTFTTDAITDTLYIRLKTSGQTPGTIVYIDSVFFTDELSIASGSSVQFGSITNSQPFYSPEDDLGEVSFNYEAGQLPLIPIFKINSSYSSLSGVSLLMNAQVDFPTNINGELGDFVLSNNGPTLVKNGGDNLSQLSSVEGYSWNSTTKTLYLPTSRIYDFNTFKVDAGTSVYFKPSSERVRNEWTQVYTKQTCQIDGSLEVKDIFTDGESRNIRMVGLDSEIFEVESPSYVGGTSGNGYSTISSLTTFKENINTNSTEVFLTNSNGYSVFLNGSITISDNTGQGFVENIDVYVGDKLIKRITERVANLPIVIGLNNEELLNGKTLRAVWFGGGNSGTVTNAVDVREWIPFSSGNNGGAGGYFILDRTRTCSYFKGTLSCENWSSFSRIGSYTGVLPKNNNQPRGTMLQGGKGAKGRPGIQAGVSTSNPANFSPSETNGGETGKRGSDGGNLFLHCYSGMSGSGTLNVSGENGASGFNGVSGTISDTSAVTIATGAGGNATKQRIYRRASGGGGAGSGGNGGHGGHLILKSRLFNHSFNIDSSGGSSGLGGNGGLFWSPWGNFQPGSNGISGINGITGNCVAYDSITEEEISCN